MQARSERDVMDMEVFFLFLELFRGKCFSVTFKRNLGHLRLEILPNEASVLLALTFFVVLHLKQIGFMVFSTCFE